MMRISDLKVDGFGVWSGLELGGLSDQLNVFYGLNEAGKTTLMQFVRSMFYGYSGERRSRYFPPLDGGNGGGELRVVEGDDTFSVKRHLDPSTPSGESLVVVGGDISGNEPALASLLGEVDEAVFNNVFAFGLREIQELGTLTATEAATELYSVALGLDRVSLVDVLSELAASRNRLLADDGRPSLVTQLVSQRERLREEIADLGEAANRYLTLSAQRQSLASEIARLEREQAELDERARQLGLACSLKDRWERRSLIDNQLALLQAADTLSVDALARFEQLSERSSLKRRRCRRLARKRRRLNEQIRQIPVNELLCRQAARFEALAEQQQWIEGLAAQVTRLEEDVLGLEATLEQHGFDAKRADTSHATALTRGKLDELRATAKSLRAARREARRLRQASKSAAGSSSEIEQKINTALGESRQQGLTQALAEAGELVSQLRKRVHLDERLDHMSRRVAQFEEQSHDHLERQIVPAWALATLGSLFVLGSALVLLFVAGLVLPASLSDALGWRVGLVGVLMAGAAGAVKIGMERRARNDLHDCHRQLGLLKEQMAEARLERDELYKQLPRGGGPLVARLQTAEKALAALEALVPLERERESAARAARDTVEAAKSKVSEIKPLRKKWQRLLAEAGLPADVAPRDLALHSRRLAQVRDLRMQWADRNAELERRRVEYDALIARVRQAVASAGVASTAANPLDQLRSCLAELSQQQKLFKERAALKRASGRLRRKRRRLAGQARRLLARRRLLLDASGAHDEAEFRRRAAAQADCQRLRGERSALAHEISTTLAGAYTEAQLAQWLSGPGNLEQLDGQTADARQAVRQRLSQATERRGEMNEQLKTLVENRQLAHMQIELGIVEQRLREAVDRWRVLAVCELILVAVRDYYEREHQPPALREASGYLARLTGGRYRRVWAPFGEHVLKVDDEQARPLGIDVLSSGAREQLFLALRLALVSSYARRGVSLPLVLDDVLVNFDVGRAKAAAAVLRDFARQGHQVFVFTCHEHIFKLFRALKVDARVLPNRSQASIEVDEGRKTTRRVAEAPIEVEEVSPASLDTEAPTEPNQSLPEPAARQNPPPAAAPTRRAAETSKRPPRRDTSTRWSAEEFEGELTDRVRDGVDDRWSQDVVTQHETDDDAEAA